MYMTLLIYLLIATSALAVPKPEDKKKDRTVDKELSSQEHYQDEQHNPQYDHEAFLGDESKAFDQLTPEESRRRLG